MSYRSWGAAVFTAVALTACGTGDTVGDGGIEEVAAEARGEVDRLAADVGTDPEVLRDVIVDCGLPGELTQGGKDLIYNLRVVVPARTLERVRGEVADRYRDDGWEVVEFSSRGTVFRRDGTNLIVNIYRDGRGATVGGSSACAG